MEFALSEDQRMLQDSLSGFLKDAAPLDTIRKIATGDKSSAAALVSGLDDFGLRAFMLRKSTAGSASVCWTLALCRKRSVMPLPPAGSWRLP